MEERGWECTGNIWTPPSLSDKQFPSLRADKVTRERKSDIPAFPDKCLYCTTDLGGGQRLWCYKAISPVRQHSPLRPSSRISTQANPNASPLKLSQGKAIPIGPQVRMEPELSLIAVLRATRSEGALWRLRVDSIYPPPRAWSLDFHIHNP